MSKRIGEHLRDSNVSLRLGRHDKDATTKTDPANFDDAAAQETLPRDFKRIVYKTDMGRGRELATGKTMDMQYKYIWKDIHKALGLKDSVREAIAKNDMFMCVSLQFVSAVCLCCPSL